MCKGCAVDSSVSARPLKCSKLEECGKMLRGRARRRGDLQIWECVPNVAVYNQWAIKGRGMEWQCTQIDLPLCEQMCDRRRAESRKYTRNGTSSTCLM